MIAKGKPQDKPTGAVEDTTQDGFAILTTDGENNILLADKPSGRATIAAGKDNMYPKLKLRMLTSRDRKSTNIFVGITPGKNLMRNGAEYKLTPDAPTRAFSMFWKDKKPVRNASSNIKLVDTDEVIVDIDITDELAELIAALHAKGYTSKITYATPSENM